MAVRSPLCLDLLMKLVKWSISVLIFPCSVFEGLDFCFFPHIDCSSVYASDRSEGLRRTTAVIHGHGSCQRARRQQPHAHICPRERKAPGLKFKSRHKWPPCPRGGFDEGIDLRKGPSSSKFHLEILKLPHCHSTVSKQHNCWRRPQPFTAAIKPQPNMGGLPCPSHEVPGPTKCI